MEIDYGYSLTSCRDLTVKRPKIFRFQTNLSSVSSDKFSKNQKTHIRCTWDSNNKEII
jgi:hypothetical protein